MRRGAQYLVRADYELRHDQEHSECNWVAGEAKCEPIDEKWPRAAPTWRRVGRATFSPVLALLPELRHAISSPAYCISGCANGAELRLFFEYQDDTYAYAIVIPEEASRRAREAGVLRAFARLFASGER